jgi:DNA-binding response OmpR family regulator
MKTKSRIYLVDDDPVFSLILKRQLESAGYECDWCSHSSQLFERLKKAESTSVLLLDFSLVGDELSGLEVCKRVKSLCNNPVVMLTGYRNTETVVACLAAGADFYIEKPYNFEQLVAKIQAISRFHDQVSSASLQLPLISNPVSSEFVFSAINRRIERDDGKFVKFTEKETDFYEIINSHDNNFVSREDAYLSIYGRVMDPMNRGIDNLACRVRSKLKLLDSTVDLQVVRGVGYKLVSNRK